MPEIQNDIDYQHERKWRRYKVTLYRQNKEIEFTAFGGEYSIDEIKSEADDRLNKYVPTSDIRSAAWQQSENTYSKQTSEYSVEIYVMP